MKRTLAYNRYPLVICTLGLLLGGLHSLFQLHQTPADTWTAAYLTAREGTELMLTENSTDPQVLRSLLHLLIGVPLLGGLFSRGYAVKGIFAATRRGRYLRFYRAEMGRLLTVTLLYNLLYCGAQALCATVAVHALPAGAAVRLIGISLFSDTLVLFGFVVLCAGLCVTRGEKAGVLLGAAAFLLAVMALFCCRYRCANTIRCFGACAVHFPRTKRSLPIPCGATTPQAAHCWRCGCCFGGGC